jgi:hypothetical protein
MADFPMIFRVRCSVGGRAAGKAFSRVVFGRTCFPENRRKHPADLAFLAKSIAASCRPLACKIERSAWYPTMRAIQTAAPLKALADSVDLKAQLQRVPRSRFASVRSAVLKPSVNQS